MNGGDVVELRRPQHVAGVLDHSVVLDVFVIIRHSERDDSCQAREGSQGLQGGKLEVRIRVLQQVWQQWDEAFHVDGLDADLLVEAVLAEERHVLDEVAEEVRHLDVALHNVSDNRDEQSRKT